MLIEAGVWLACAYALNEFRNRDIRKFNRAWNGIMNNARSDGLRNKDNESFKLLNITREDYGYRCIVDIPFGLSHSALEKSKEIIEDKLGCIVEFEKEKFKNYIIMKIIKSNLGNIEFEPVATKNHELFLGYKYDNTVYTLDLNKDPHVILSGKTGTGKSFLLASVLTNLIYYHSKSSELYLLQKMKGEINIFKDCKNVKFSSNNEEEILLALDKLNKTIHNRSVMFSEMGVKNITQWNKHYPKRFMKRIIVVAEEISFFMEDKESKAFEYFTSIVKAGRSAGVHFIALTQRTTASNLGGNGELKSQMTVVTAKQRSELDSRNAIDISDAKDLLDQEFISSCNDGYVFFKAPHIDEDFKILNKYVREIKIPQVKAKKDIKAAIQDPTMTIIDVTNYEFLEHEKWKTERGIKTTEIDLSKLRKEKQQLQEYQAKADKTKPTKTHSKKGKIALNEEVATDVNG